MRSLAIFIIAACGTTDAPKTENRPVFAAGVPPLIVTDSTLVGKGSTASPLGEGTTAVTPSSYTNSNITVDSHGRITAASNGGSSFITGAGTTGDLTAWSSSSSLGNYAGSSPSACSAGQAMTNDALSAAGVLSNTCSAFVTSSTLTNHIIPVATGAGALANSSITDTGSAISTSEPVTISNSLTADTTHRVFDIAGTGLTSSTNTVSLSMTGASCSAGSFMSAIGATGTGTCTAAPTYLGRQVLSASSGTYTPTAGTLKVLLRMCGGGGGSGGINSGGGGTAAATGGGASGGYLEKWINPGTTVTGSTYGVGTGGTAGTTVPAAGGLGVDTTIIIQSVTYTAKGGGGSAGLTETAGLQLGAGGTPTAVSSSGDVTQGGQPGSPGFMMTTSTGIGGNGGESPLGSGGRGASSAGAGAASTGNCAGAGGSLAVGASGQAGQAGGAGLIIVDEWR